MLIHLKTMKMIILYENVIYQNRPHFIQKAQTDHSPG